jgi:non-ribosomal peptide synthetase component F
MILLSIYTILLSKYSGQEDIIVGTPTAGRHHADLENMIGMLVNTLAVRNYPGREKTYREFLNEVKINCLNAYENQDFQFEELVYLLGYQPDSKRHPLFDTMLAVQNVNIKTRESGNAKDLIFKPYPFEDKVTQFDIIIHAHENETEKEDKPVISFKLLYCTGLFKKSTMGKFVRHFNEIAAMVLENNEIKLEAIKLSGGLMMTQAADLQMELAI